MWTNKHVIIAMLVAPVLAIMAWFAVDYLVAEQAQPATAGSMYSLIARPNCRYDSGKCDLANNEFKLSIRPVKLENDRTILSLKPEFELEQVTLALVIGSSEVVGNAAATTNPEGETVWIVNFPAYAEPEAALRVAVAAQESVYFAEVPVVFMRSPPPLRR
jgi:hypothetical protein